MRLWPLCIIKQLPRQQLLGQHRECCALRGMGWGKKHATVNYVFEHPYWWLADYHRWVMIQMLCRGYTVAPEWLNEEYRGKNIGTDNSVFTKKDTTFYIVPSKDWDKGGKWYPCIYSEHNEDYLDECIQNLSQKGVQIDREDAIKSLYGKRKTELFGEIDEIIERYKGAAFRK